MSLLQNDHHYSDAELTASEMAEKFAKNALEILNEQPARSSINTSEVLASLVTAQAIVYLGQCYITPLITEFETMNEKLSDIAENSDFSASQLGGADHA